MIDSIKADAVDYYARIRTLYRQNREAAIRNGQLEDIPLPALSEGDWNKESTPTLGLSISGKQTSQWSE